MNEKDVSRVKRFRKAFRDEEGIKELTDSEILMRIELDKRFYNILNKNIKTRIKKLNSL